MQHVNVIISNFIFLRANYSISSTPKSQILLNFYLFVYSRLLFMTSNSTYLLIYIICRRYMDWRVELEQLREVIPNYALQDYWNISYGRCLEDNDHPARKMSGLSGSSGGLQTSNLPDLPSRQSSPIPGCSMPR